MASSSSAIARASAPVRVTLGMIIGTLLLFLLYAYEPISFSYSLRHILPALGAAHEAPANLTLQLHPQDHRHRDNTTLRFSWAITRGYRYPDGVGKWVYLVNGTSVLRLPLVTASSGLCIASHLGSLA